MLEISGEMSSSGIIAGIISVPFIILIGGILYLAITAVVYVFKPFDDLKLFGQPFNSVDFAVGAFVAMFLGPLAYAHALLDPTGSKMSGALGVTFTCIIYILAFLYLSNV